jgi:hypothetical protein
VQINWSGVIKTDSWYSNKFPYSTVAGTYIALIRPSALHRSHIASSSKRWKRRLLMLQQMPCHRWWWYVTIPVNTTDSRGLQVGGGSGGSVYLNLAISRWVLLCILCDKVCANLVRFIRWNYGNKCRCTFNSSIVGTKLITINGKVD